MEYLPNTITLKKYFKKYNQNKSKNTGLPIKQIKGLRLIIGDKKIILREEFLEFHFNIFWITHHCIRNKFIT